MEKKERYELLNYCIYDNKLKKYVCSPCASMKIYMEILTDLLNQKDKRIKELELLLKADKKIETNSLNGFEKLRQENQQLKEKLKVVDDFMHNYGYSNYDYGEILEDLQTRAFKSEDDTKIVEELLDHLNLSDENKILLTIKQSQKQLAIEELEKVKQNLKKESYRSFLSECVDIEDVKEIIDNQIKELKGDK